MNEYDNGNTKNYVKLGLKIVAGTVTGLVLLSAGCSSYTKVNSGEVVRVQNNVTGNAEWYMNEGYKLKAPFVSSSVRYPQEITIGVSDNPEVCSTASACSDPRRATFADTYTITMETVNRYSLPRSPELLEKMHDKVKSVDNLVGTVLLPFSQDLLGYTSSQYAAETFLQGQQNDFRNKLIDQAENGLIQTKRIKKLITTEVANRDTDREYGKPTTGEQYKYEIEPVVDADGNFIRTPASITEYGITLVPSGISLVDYIPSATLADFMADKQGRVRKRAGIIEDQENERQRAITAELKGNADRITQQNKLLIEKDKATIDAERKVEVEALEAERETIVREKVASLAIIDKKREQQVATANLNIEKANAEAAKYAAQAILEKGLADAKVKKAMYQAVDKEVLSLEVQKDIAKSLYTSNMNITMPKYVGGTGGTGIGSSLEAMSSLKVMEMLAPKNILTNQK